MGSGYMKKQVPDSLLLRLVLIFVIGGGLFGLAFFFSLSVGTVSISGAELWRVLTGQDYGPVFPVVWLLRMPRTLLAAGVGAALSMAGVALQAVLRNPLADPYIVGTSSGAALGAALAMVCGLGQTHAGGLWVPAAAFVGAVVATLFVYRLAQVDGVVGPDTLLLSGVMVGAFLGAMVSFVMSIARKDLPRVVMWLMGSLEQSDWERCIILLPYLIAGGIGLYLNALRLNLMALGEDSARQLGVDTDTTRRRVLLWATLLTAASVSVSGLIGFVGLLIPHLTRNLLGADHRVLLPGAAWGGAVFLLLSDIFVRCLSNGGELPVGVVTAGMGAPFFFVLLHGRKGRA